MFFLNASISSVKKCHFEQNSRLRVLDMEDKLKTTFAPIVEDFGSLHFGASIHKITFCLSVSAAGASEENLRDFFHTLLENAMKNAPKGMFVAFYSRNQ